MPFFFFSNMQIQNQAGRTSRKKNISSTLKINFFSKVYHNTFYIFNIFIPLDKLLSLPVVVKLEVLSLCFVLLHWGSQDHRMEETPGDHQV